MSRLKKGVEYGGPKRRQFLNSRDLSHPRVGVGERESLSFKNKNSYYMNTIIYQAQYGANLDIT